MQMATLEKLGDTIVLTLPAVVVRALHLHAGEEMVVEVEGERLVLTRMPVLFREVQVVYQTLGPCYREVQAAG